jgi:hypothetical protein
MTKMFEHLKTCLEKNDTNKALISDWEMYHTRDSAKRKKAKVAAATAPAIQAGMLSFVKRLEPRPASQDRVQDAIAKFVVATHQPLSLVDEAAFRCLLDEVFAYGQRNTGQQLRHLSRRQLTSFLSEDFLNRETAPMMTELQKEASSFGLGMADDGRTNVLHAGQVGAVVVSPSVSMPLGLREPTEAKTETVCAVCVSIRSRSTSLQARLPPTHTHAHTHACTHALHSVSPRAGLRRSGHLP